MPPAIRCVDGATLGFWLGFDIVAAMGDVKEEKEKDVVVKVEFTLEFGSRKQCISRCKRRSYTTDLAFDQMADEQPLRIAKIDCVCVTPTCPPPRVTRMQSASYKACCKRV
jgi:hypothetical protein